MKETAMRIKMFMLWVCLLTVCSGVARAADRDPLWDRAVATIALASRSVASRIETRTEVYNGKEERMETQDKIETLTGWNGQEPIRKSETTRNVVKKSGLTVSIDMGAKDNPFFASSEGRATHERAGEDTLDGNRCIIFRFEETPPSGTKDEIGPLVGTAWVERETGAPLKVLYRPKKMPKHVSASTLTLLFSVLPDSSTVPRALDMQMKAGFLWYKRVVRLHKNFSGWTTPPDAVAKDLSPGIEPAYTQ
jgi:hypothetical protein